MKEELLEKNKKIIKKKLLQKIADKKTLNPSQFDENWEHTCRDAEQDGRTSPSGD